METEWEARRGRTLAVPELHDSLLKKKRHLAEPIHALINQTPWGGCFYPAFLVVQGTFLRPSVCRHLSSAPSLPLRPDQHRPRLREPDPVQGFHDPVRTVWINHPWRWRCCHAWDYFGATLRLGRWQALAMWPLLLQACRRHTSHSCAESTINAWRHIHVLIQRQICMLVLTYLLQTHWWAEFGQSPELSDNWYAAEGSSSSEWPALIQWVRCQVGTKLWWETQSGPGSSELKGDTLHSGRPKCMALPWQPILLHRSASNARRIFLCCCSGHNLEVFENMLSLVIVCRKLWIIYLAFSAVNRDRP